MLYLWRAIRNWKFGGIKHQSKKLESDNCPYQTGENCALHAFRPSGCRIFYCKEPNRQFQEEITEQVIESLRFLHVQFEAVYYYADLLEWLSRTEQLINRNSSPQTT
jgi:Fe-S-cluster containining protein